MASIGKYRQAVLEKRLSVEWKGERRRHTEEETKDRQSDSKRGKGRGDRCAHQQILDK